MNGSRTSRSARWWGKIRSGHSLWVSSERYGRAALAASRSRGAQAGLFHLATTRHAAQQNVRDNPRPDQRRSARIADGASWHGASIGTRAWQTSKTQFRDEQVMANAAPAAYREKRTPPPSR